MIPIASSCPIISAAADPTSPTIPLSLQAQQPGRGSGTLLDHLGLDRELTLVLHDWGGNHRHDVCGPHPDRIARLVVSNTAGFHKPVASLAARCGFCRVSRSAGGSSGACTFRPGYGMDRMQASEVSRDLRRAYVHPYDSWANRIAVLRFVQDIPLRPGDPSFELVSWVQHRLHRLKAVPMMIPGG